MSPRSERIGQVLGGRYRLLAPLGSGASATVYLADDVVLRRRVAVKVLHEMWAGDPSLQKRFQAEARSAAALSNPHIVVVHDWGQADVPFLVTELLEGGSLRAMLDSGVRLSPAQIRQIGRDAARALDHAHRRGVVHRDIKPANLLFDADGVLRIADFGVARALADAAWTEPSGAVLGTARYASPEQAAGRQLDGKSDVYSLALVLVEAATGQLPFVADTSVGTLMARVDQPLPVPERLGAFGAVLRAAGTADPNDRIDAATFAQMLDDLGDLGPVAPLPLAGIGQQPPTPSAPVEFVTAADLHSDITAVVPMMSPDPTGVQPMPRQVARPESRKRFRWWMAAIPALVIVIAAIVGFFLLRPASYVLGDYQNQSIEIVRAELEAKGFKVAQTDEFNDATAGTVLSQDPAAGTNLQEGKTVSLLVSKGPVPVPVPTNLVGMTVEQATAALTAAQLKLGTLTPKFDESVPKDVVLSLAPDVAAQMPKGSAIGLIISDGPAPRTIPEGLVGKPFTQVETQLKDLGLVVRKTEDFSDTVPEGSVISVTPASGQTAEKGSTVTVLVSKGKKVVIPNTIVGKTVAQAETILRGLGLSVRGVTGSPSGTVTSSDPAVGSTVKVGTEVQLITR